MIRAKSIPEHTHFKIHTSNLMLECSSAHSVAFKSCSAADLLSLMAAMKILTNLRSLTSYIWHWHTSKLNLELAYRCSYSPGRVINLLFSSLPNPKYLPHLDNNTITGRDRVKSEPLTASSIPNTTPQLPTRCYTPPTPTPLKEPMSHLQPSDTAITPSC